MASGKSIELQNIAKPSKRVLWDSSTLGTFAPRKPRIMTEKGIKMLNAAVAAVRGAAK